MNRQVIIAFLLLLLLSKAAVAQQSFFTFSYPGPDTLFLGPTCGAVLDGNIGTPVVGSTVGATITQSEFNATASGFQFTDTLRNPKTVTVHWQVADNQGHTANFTFPIILKDKIKPKFDLTGIPPTLTFLSLNQVPPPPDIPASDNCSNVADIEIDFYETSRPPFCEQGTFSRVWTATDESDNSTTFIQVINIITDNAPPTITGFPVNGFATCQNLSVIYPNWLATQLANFQAVDPSGIASKSHNGPSLFPGPCPSPLTVTFTVFDSCGYSSFATAVFNVTDNAPPTMVTPARDTIVSCNFSGNQLAVLGQWISTRGGLVATDDCTPVSKLKYKMQVNGNDVDSAGVVAAFLASFINGCGFQTVGSQIVPKVRGVIPVDFFAFDYCNNLGFIDRGWFAAVDTLAPRFNGPALADEQCGGGNDSLALAAWITSRGGGVTDDCSQITYPNFTWTTSTGLSGTGNYAQPATWPQLPASACSWHTDVIFKALDECGNASQRSMRWRLRDTIVPVFTGLVARDTFFCPEIPPTTPTFTTSDNCDKNILLQKTTTVSDSICPQHLTLTLLWTATDDCGNATTAEQIFLVRDTLAPVFSKKPTDTTTTCSALPAAPVLGTDFAAADLCGTLDTVFFVENSTQDADPAKCEHYKFLITRTFTALDVCGNSRVHVQTITVEDTLAPVFNGFPDTTQACDQLGTLPTPTASGECGQAVTAPVLANETITAGACPDSYRSTLTWNSTDVCGNIGVFVQVVEVGDLKKPVLAGVPVSLDVECDAIPLPPAIGTALTASDNCDESVSISFLQTEIRNPDANTCEHWSSYGIQRTWIASDNCGNTTSATQLIAVQDNTGPVLTCNANAQWPTEPGKCTANAFLPALLGVYDACSGPTTAVVLADSAAIVNTSGQPSNDVPVDTIFLDFTAPNLFPNQPASGPATLTIFLKNADAEQPDEHFKIFDEKGNLLDQTAPTAGQCGSSQKTLSIPENVVNAWFSDGNTTLTLVPNGTGSDAPNAVCFGGGSAKATLEYNYATPALPITVQFSLDGGARQNWPPGSGFSLESGSHDVRYFATDCAGNESACSLKINVLDNEPPVVAMPSSQTIFTGQTDCNATAVLPFPTLSDNCGFDGFFEKTSPTKKVKFFTHPNAGQIPQDIQLDVAGANPNAVGTGKLIVCHRGDNAQFGEFFKILDENGVPLTSTTSSANSPECNGIFQSIVPVSETLLRSWAADGTVSFRLVANNDAGNFSDFISPCGPLLPDATDGISELSVKLEYGFANVHFKIKNSGGVVVQSGTLAGDSTKVSLPAENFTVEYEVTDANAMASAANFALTVRDTVRPLAVCAPTTIFANPSGTETYVLTPMEIDGGSSDNCSPSDSLVRTISHTTFGCADAGTVTNVTLTVRDQSGNQSQCSALVKVVTAAFQPTFTAGICEGDAVQFFANPPAASGNVVFTYSWSGPGGFTSSEANPTLPVATAANEGPYVVTISGITGCTASASVVLDVVNMPSTPVLIADKVSICDGLDDGFLLKTGIYSGLNVQYLWYSGTPGVNETLLGTTITNEFFVPQPLVGSYQFFVKISINGCQSMPSAALPAQVFTSPTAAAQQSAILLCEGEPLALGAMNQGPTVIYQWTGPNGFISTAQFPPVIQQVSLLEAGPYSLVVVENGCPSPVLTVNVTVKPTPPAPELAPIPAACVGERVDLVCNTLNASDFYWVSPNFDTILTNLNALTLSSASLSDSGFWQVFVVQNGCRSMTSVPKKLVVEQQPQVAISANTPLCQDSLLRLSASSNVSNLDFKWTGPSNFVSFSPTPITSPVAGTYTLIASTPAGCADTTSLFVQVSPEPVVVQVKYSTPWVNGVQGCVSGTDPLVLEAILVQQIPGSNYVWTGPNGQLWTDPMPVLAHADQSINGTYTVRVTSPKGCVSEEKSVVIDIRERPVTPVLEIKNNPVCEGDPVEITVVNGNQYTGNALIFNWTTPAGNPPTVTGVYQIASVNAANQAGNYSVVVSVDQCPSLPSAPTNLIVHPTPVAPAISANTPLCEGDTLLLSAPQIPGVSYVWSGPVGFSASVHNPSIFGVASVHSGDYQLVVEIDGCASLPGEPVAVEVKPRPKQPVAQHDGAVCLDAPGADLTLSVTPGSMTQNAIYTWYSGSTGLPLGAPTLAQQYVLTDFQGFIKGQTAFYATASLNGCVSEASMPTVVTFNSIPPNVAYAGADFKACDEKPLYLDAQAPSVGSGHWTQVAGPLVTILNPDDPKTGVVGVAAGKVYEFTWRLSNGACVDYSTDLVAVQVSAYEQAQALDVIDTCYVESVLLQAVTPISASGSWSQPTGQSLLGIEIENPSDPHSAVNFLEPGNTYFFFWTLPDIGCGVSTDTLALRVIGSVAYAGDDRQLCIPSDCVLLEAGALPNFEKGAWSALDPEVTITSPTSTQTTACGLKTGDNFFVWQTNDGFCGEKSRDTVRIRFELQPTGVNDSVTVIYGHETVFSVWENDIFPPDFSVEIVAEPEHGTVEKLAEGDFKYLPDIAFSGRDKLIYKICNLQCDSSCGIATVFFNVLDPVGCEIPSIFTPNGDGYNDVFVVPCLGGDVQQDNEVTIFNQWGDEVFHAQPYGNDWAGEYNGEPLPAGTYFYVVKLNGDQGTKSGFVLIQR